MSMWISSQKTKNDVKKLSPKITYSRNYPYLLVSQLFPQVGHHVAELGCADEAIAVLVEHPEGLPDLFLAKNEIFDDLWWFSTLYDEERERRENKAFFRSLFSNSFTTQWKKYCVREIIYR